MKNIPTKSMVRMNTQVAGTKAHAKRLRAGILESRPEDYRINADEESIKARDARRRIEDLRIARELGIDPDQQ